MDVGTNRDDLVCRACMRVGWKIRTDPIPLVFSDCLPWSGPQAIWFACNCGYVGKACDQDYESALTFSYANYSPFHQGGGEEQAVTQDGSSFLSRSSKVLTWLLKENLIRSTGSLLDFGCGNGSFLKASAALIPSMNLHAADINDSHRDAVLSLPNVHSFQVLPLEPKEVEKFDVISLIHVLEHLPDPIATLGNLASRLTQDGVIVIQVPDLSANFFDLVVADHLSHFTEKSASDLVRAAGFEVVASALGVVPKEITIILRKASSNLSSVSLSNDPSRQLTSDAFEFLEKWKAAAGAAGDSGLPVSIFGSSIAASWAVTLLEDRGHLVKEFLDEDPARLGGQLRGIKIKQPSRAASPERRVVLVPLVPVVSVSVSARLQSLGFETVFLS